MVKLNKKIKLFALLLVSFFANTMLLNADASRSGSLTLTALNETDFSVVWKIPALGNAPMRLSLELSEDTKVITPKTSDFFRGSFVENYTASRPTGLDGINIKIDGNGLASADIIVRIIDVKGNVITKMLNASEREFTLKGDEKQERMSLSYIILGFEHILIGLDHLLFIACLIYISRTRKKLLLTITGFTIAHSVTLIVSSMGYVNFPGPPVESSIALSIIFLAVEIAKNRKNSLTLKYPIAVSSSFGLLHGFGFASVLGDIGLPSEEKVLALLYFNVGVEIGQLFFVACLMAIFFMLRLVFKKLTQDKLRLFVAYTAGALSMMWLLERLSMF